MASISDLATAAMASSPPQCIDGIEVHPKHRVRGAFIVLEGLDRSGKTTQVKLLEQRFVEEGQPVKAMRFPGRSAIRRGLSRCRAGPSRSPRGTGSPKAGLLRLSLRQTGQHPSDR